MKPFARFFGLPSGNGISTVTDTFRDKILQMKKDYILGNESLKDAIKINDININSPIPFDIKNIWIEFYSRGYGTYNTAVREPNDYAYQTNEKEEQIKGDAEI